mmetsp:Transcript_44179/g.99844  ORF Transcript_44179/g.99844 Transcript_44179/m.99844 type:complete len:339 (+) Transcript_44179:648-1664(+)
MIARSLRRGGGARAVPGRLPQGLRLGVLVLKGVVGDSDVHNVVRFPEPKRRCPMRRPIRPFQLPPLALAASPASPASLRGVARCRRRRGVELQVAAAELAGIEHGQKVVSAVRAPEEVLDEAPDPSQSGARRQTRPRRRHREHVEQSPQAARVAHRDVAPLAPLPAVAVLFGGKRSGRALGHVADGTPLDLVGGGHLAHQEKVLVEVSQPLPVRPQWLALRRLGRALASLFGGVLCPSLAKALAKGLGFSAACGHPISKAGQSFPVGVWAGEGACEQVEEAPERLGLALAQRVALHKYAVVQREQERGTRVPEPGPAAPVRRPSEASVPSLPRVLEHH